MPDTPVTAGAPESEAFVPVAPGRILALANQKGGVGKTTTAINLGTALAAVGNKVLLVDIDPQGNASTGIGIAHADRTISAYHLLFGEAELEGVRLGSEVPGLDVVPSSPDLSGAEIELIESDQRETRLRNVLHPATAEYDFILIDCPPTLGLLTLNALVAADAVLVPLQCEFYALEGLSHLMRTIERVKRAFNPDLVLQGIVLTMFDRRNRLSEMVARDVREFFGDKVYETVIPRNVRVSEAPSYGKPVLLYDLQCAGSQAYLQLARELLQREKGERA